MDNHCQGNDHHMTPADVRGCRHYDNHVKRIHL